MLEYYFFLNAAGRISLAPFELSVPVPEDPESQEKTEVSRSQGQAGDPGNTREEARRIRFRSPAIQFLVRTPGEAGAGQSSSRANPRLSWRGPARLHPGEEAELTLVHQGWDLSLPLPSPQPLMPRTPIGAILEASPPREDDEAAGVLLRLRLIPLEEGRLNIAGFKAPAGDYSLDIPALSIPVIPAAAQDRPAAIQAAVSAPSGLSPGEPSPASGEDLAFPEISPNPLPLFRAGCESIRSQARALWGRGFRVEALAELRRNERDYTGGPALIPLRRELEKLLGLPGNGDETWRPRFLLTGIFIVSAVLAGASLFLSFFFQKKRVTPGPAWCYRVIGKFDRFQKELFHLKKPGWVFRIFVVFFVFTALFSLWRRGDLSAVEPFPGSSGPPRPALTRKTEAFRVPGPAGTVAFRFEEGRRVLVRSIREDWAYVEIPGREEGEKAGWVRREALVFY
jgi:hypothetical protein